MPSGISISEKNIVIIIVDNTSLVKICKPVYEFDISATSAAIASEITAISNAA